MDFKNVFLGGSKCISVRLPYQRIWHVFGIIYVNFSSATRVM